MDDDGSLEISTTNGSVPGNGSVPADGAVPGNGAVPDASAVSEVVPRKTAAGEFLKALSELAKLSVCSSVSDTGVEDGTGNVGLSLPPSVKGTCFSMASLIS